MATKIGTRGSKLALKQVDIVVEELGISDYEVVIIKTEGDRISEEGKTQFDKLNFVEAIDLVDLEISDQPIKIITIDK